MRLGKPITSLYWRVGVVITLLRILMYKLQGSGKIFDGQVGWRMEDFLYLGSEVVIEETVRVWHPGRIKIGDGTYIGNDVMLKGYPHGPSISIRFGERCWVGERAYLHGAGGIAVGSRVGIGPNVSILTSLASEDGQDSALDLPLIFKPVSIESNVVIHADVRILPGCVIGAGSIIEQGALIEGSIPPLSIVSGNPAVVIRKRNRGSSFGQLYREAL